MKDMDMRSLRVGDDEREHALDLLRRAADRGLIGRDEFTARTDTAQAAVTRGELNAVLADLPGAQAAPERLELAATLSTPLVRSGPWTVPRQLAVRNRWNRVDLDFTEARFPHGEVRITLDALGGPVALRLPTGATVTIHNLGTSWGATVDDRRESADAGPPYIVINGSLRMAPLTIDAPEEATWKRDHGRHGRP